MRYQNINLTEFTPLQVWVKISEVGYNSGSSDAAFALFTTVWAKRARNMRLQHQSVPHTDSELVYVHCTVRRNVFHILYEFRLLNNSDY